MKIAMRTLSLCGLIATFVETCMKFYYHTNPVLGILWGITTIAWGYVTWFNWTREW